MDDENTEDSEDWKGKYVRLKTRNAADRERLSELEGKLEGLEGQLKALKPKADAHDSLQQQIATLTQERDGERSGRAFDRAVAGKGITDGEAIDLVRARYQGLPEKDRPTPEAYIDTLTADPAKVPKWLAGYLQSSQSQQGQGATSQQQSQQGQPSQQVANAGSQQQRPDPNRTAVPTNGTQGAWKPTNEDRARAHAMMLKGDKSLHFQIMAADGFAVETPLVALQPATGGGANTNGVG
jgi:hypothetical protein